MTYTLEDLQNNELLKKLNKKELSLFATDLRQYIIDMTAKNGGHLSSNLGIVELTMSLFRVFDLPRDKILFDVGHQCYPYKVLSGRSLENLRKKDGISGFQKRSESIYDCFEAGHSSTSISASLGMAIARDLDGDDYSVIAVIGDAAILSGMSFEALNDLGHQKHKVIVILNDNDMSISQPVGGLAKFFSRIRISLRYNSAKSGYQRFMSKTRVGTAIYKFTSRLKNRVKKLILPMNYFDNLGLNYLGPIDGHDMKSLEKNLKRAKKSKKSVILHLHTQKGRGYSYAEKDKTGYWHGVSPFNVATGLPLVNNPLIQSWSTFFGDLVYEAMEKNESAIVIAPATLKGSDLEEVFATYQARCFDVGISEEHAITLAAGMSLNGKHPIISIYSTFLQRGFDQINHDLCRMNLNTTLLIDRSGLIGNDGETHQGIYDEAFLMSTPQMTLTFPSTPGEAKALLSESFNNHGPFAIKYPRDFLNKVPSIPEVVLEYGKWVISSLGLKNTIVISFGPLFGELERLILEKDSRITFINAIYQKPYDQDMLLSFFDSKRIIIIDFYATRFGFVNEIASFLSCHGFKGEILTFAINDQFVKQASSGEQLKDLGISPEQLVNIILED